MPDLPSILGTDQPESPERTKDLGNILAEAVRALNYATMGDAPGLKSPVDVYGLLSALYTATGRLPQLLGQLGAFLRRQGLDDRMRDTHGRDPALQAGMAADLLEDCSTRVPGITAHLQRAQNDIAGLYVENGAEGEGSSSE